MISLVVLSVLLVAAQAQYQPRWKADNTHVRILNDNRAQSILGDFKVKYAQEDGTNFDEVTSADGNRRGSYSYYDDKGKKHEIHYEAGKGGFRIVGGNIPKAHVSAGVKPAVPSWEYPPSHPIWQSAAPKSKRVKAPQPVHHTPVQHTPVHHTPVQYTPVQKKVAQPAPYSYSVTTGQNKASVSYNPPVTHFQPQHQPQPVQVPAFIPQPLPAVQPTHIPTRFFPPGNLKLQRTHQGYAYSFSS